MREPLKEEAPGLTAIKFGGISLRRPTCVSVVGAGVIGLSTALLAQDRGYDVSIFTDKPTSETTSAKAAASFKPGTVVYNDLAHRAVELSWDAFGRIVRGEEPAKTGVRMHTLWEASSSPGGSAQHLKVMENVQTFETPDVPGGYAHGWRYRTYFADTRLYLPWMIDKFQAQGGKLHTLAKKLIDPAQFNNLPGDTVFNCTGLGAKELVGDDALVPVKGQVALTAPLPDMDWTINADGFYVYPRSHDTVLGGTTEWGIEDEQVESGAVSLIVQGNKRILPHLSLEHVIGSYAGLRPFRRGSIRIEAESMGDKQIIHNYGHGGSGVTMSWGSAQLAVDLI